MTKSTKWFLAVLAVLGLFVIGFSLLLISLVSTSTDRTETVTTGSGEKLAVVELNGVITSSEDLVRQFKKYRETRSIKGIILRVDSPGGGAVASQEMYQEVKKTRESGKPVVVSMGALAASGGYYVSCGATKLVANPGTLTGSIGVISEFLQLQEALGKIGVGVKTIKSGKLKDAGSPMKKMSTEDEQYFQALMDDVHHQFIGVVEAERKLDHKKILSLADGRVFTGKQAVELGLVDTLGSFEDAVTIAADLAGIKGEPSLVKEHRRRSLWEGFFSEMIEGMAKVKQETLERPILSYRFVNPF
jgi:protease-4